MGAELLKMADSLAVETGNGKNAGKAGKESTEIAGAKEMLVAVEDIRAVLAQKSQDGKSKEIKELLGKYGAAKLSAVQQEDYLALLQEAKVL